MAATLEPHSTVLGFCKSYLRYSLYSFIPVVDPRVSGIGARCNQATVAFLRLLISALFLFNYAGRKLQRRAVYRRVFLSPRCLNMSAETRTAEVGQS